MIHSSSFGLLDINFGYKCFSFVDNPLSVALVRRPLRHVRRLR